VGLRPLKNLCEVAVIGGGLAGLSAARHAARLGHLVTLFEGSGMYGGLVATIGHVEDLPFPGDYSGQELAMHLYEQAKKVGVQVVEANIERIALDDRITLTDWEGRDWHPEAVVLATGASLKALGVPGEEQFTGRGVSRCATCDGGFYRGKTVVVTGGGDGAVHEAMVLATTSGEVIMVCRGPLKAKREHLDKLDARENLRFIWDSEVIAVLGDMKMTGLRLRNLRDGSESEIACDGFFPFIGVTPNSAMVPPALLDERGLVRTGDRTACSAQSGDPRLFAAGAVRAEYGGTATQAMAEGISAAAAAHDFLKGNHDGNQV
jgi:thioredoxin reductase (NADPH)